MASREAVYQWSPAPSYNRPFLYAPWSSIPCIDHRILLSSHKSIYLFLAKTPVWTISWSISYWSGSFFPSYSQNFLPGYFLSKVHGHTRCSESVDPNRSTVDPNRSDLGCIHGWLVAKGPFLGWRLLYFEMSEDFYWNKFLLCSIKPPPLISPFYLQTHTYSIW